MDNSAKRLLLIIEAGKDESINTKSTCREVWKKILKVPPNDEALLTSRIGKTMALIGEIKEDLNALENVNSERYLGWVPSVTKAFSEQKLDVQWSAFANQITNHTIDYLSNSSDILNMSTPRNELDIKTITDITDSISELIKEIMSSDLPPDVKRFMVAKLREIELAADEYHISGSKPITDTVETIFGHLYLNKEFRESAKKESSFGFWNILGKLVLVTTFAVNGLVIGNEMKKYLPAPVVEQIESVTEEKSLNHQEDIQDAEYTEIIDDD